MVNSRYELTLEIPDEMVASLFADGREPARVVIEALAIEGYRSGVLTASQTCRLLGFGTRYELDGVLKEHSVWEHAYSLEDLEKDRKTWDKLPAESRLSA